VGREKEEKMENLRKTWQQEAIERGLDSSFFHQAYSQVEAEPIDEPTWISLTRSKGREEREREKGGEDG